MKRLLLVFALLLFVGCEQQSNPLKYDYWGDHEVWTVEKSAGNYTCQCGFRGLAHIEWDLYVCSKCGMQYQIIQVGEMIVIIPK